MKRITTLIVITLAFMYANAQNPYGEILYTLQ